MPTERDLRSSEKRKKKEKKNASKPVPTVKNIKSYQLHFIYTCKAEKN